jgi:integral membrane protein
MLSIFRLVSFLEGVSYILLLFIAVPIKYWGNNEFYVKLLGMPHGILFMVYVGLAFVLKNKLKWQPKVFYAILLASVIPLGTFYADRKYLKN